MDFYEDWPEKFAELGIIETGHFRLHSGLHSDRYINKDALYARQMVLWEFAYEIVTNYLSIDVIDVVVGPESGGAKFASMIEMIMDGLADKTIPCAYAEQSGDGGYIFKRKQGALLSGQRVLIVDDVLTTGDTLRKVVELVKSYGGIPQSIYVIWDRSENRPDIDVHIEAFQKIVFPLWEPGECPLCEEGVPLSEEFV